MFGLFKRKSGGSPPSNAEAIACYERGDYEGALTRVDALIAQVPNVAMSHRFRGETLFELQRYDDAATAFRAAESIGGPGTEEVFFWRALALANAGRPSDAIELLQQYLASPNASRDLASKCSAAIQAMSK